MNSRVFEKSGVAAAAESPGTRRLNLTFPQKAYDEVASLAKTQQRSMSDIFRLALGLVRIALGESAKGKQDCYRGQGRKPG